jgi:hypothetical protein
MSSDAQKLIKKLVRRARKQGWTIGHYKSGHTRFTTPDQSSSVSVSSSPRSIEGVRKAEQELRKAGLE